VIFVTIGTSEPFDRLLEAVERLPGDEELVVQVGDSSNRPSRAACVEYLRYDELRELMVRARVVVTHAGVFGEAVDDHQVALARRLDEAGLVTVVEDLALLGDAVARPPALNGHGAGTGSLVSDLREFLTQSVGRSPRQAVESSG
jgi:UDP-N-acetylglucosamine transferase subunit ALG13